MNKVVLMDGPARSGKTHIAKVIAQFGEDFMYLDFKVFQDKFENQNEAIVAFYQRAREVVENGHNCILDATFLYRWNRAEALKAFDGLEVETYCVYRITSLETCLLRNQVSDDPAPASTIRSSYEQFEYPVKELENFDVILGV